MKISSELSLPCLSLGWSGKVYLLYTDCIYATPITMLCKRTWNSYRNASIMVNLKVIDTQQKALSTVDQVFYSSNSSSWTIDVIMICSQWRVYCAVGNHIDRAGWSCEHVHKVQNEFRRMHIANCLSCSVGFGFVSGICISMYCAENRTMDFGILSETIVSVAVFWPGVVVFQ